MVDDTCPLPMEPGLGEGEAVRRMLEAKRIAVVGLSDNPNRPSFGVAEYLMGAGYEIVPVNPNHAEVMGLRCFATLKEIVGRVDVVLVFRRSEFCAELAREAVSIGAKGLWLQSGIRSGEAERLARGAGMDYVEDRCMMVERWRLK